MCLFIRIPITYYTFMFWNCRKGIEIRFYWNCLSHFFLLIDRYGYCSHIEDTRLVIVYSSCVYLNCWSSMIFNFVLYLSFLTFFDSSVNDEYFVDETRVWSKYKISILESIMSLFYLQNTPVKVLKTKRFEISNSSHKFIVWYVSILLLSMFAGFNCHICTCTVLCLKVHTYVFHYNQCFLFGKVDFWY